jgi:salicylate hydroxylase
MLASLGQGGNMALEDGLILGRCFERYGDDVTLALTRYQDARVERTTKITLDSNAQSTRRLRPELADPVEAPKVMNALWSAANVSKWYDWIFQYDAVRAPI